jgi:hypothetical protein
MIVENKLQNIVAFRPVARQRPRDKEILKPLLCNGLANEHVPTATIELQQ